VNRHAHLKLRELLEHPNEKDEGNQQLRQTEMFGKSRD